MDLSLKLIKCSHLNTVYDAEGTSLDSSAALHLLWADLPGGPPWQLTRHLCHHHLTAYAGQCMHFIRHLLYGRYLFVTYQRMQAIATHLSSLSSSPPGHCNSITSIYHNHLRLYAGTCSSLTIYHIISSSHRVCMKVTMQLNPPLCVHKLTYSMKVI